MAFCLRLVHWLILIVDRGNTKLMIHDYNYAVFFLSLVVLPILIYAVKMIPLRWQVYSEVTMGKLETYTY